MSGRLYVGIDLGTFQSTIASSAGAMHSIETVVGRPKDPVARNFLKRDVLFGADALKNKLAEAEIREKSKLQDEARRKSKMRALKKLKQGKRLTLEEFKLIAKEEAS